MGRKTKKDKAPSIELRLADRSTPTEQTLLQFAQERGLFERAEKRNKIPQDPRRQDDEEGGMSPFIERVLDTLLYAVCLATLHFTLDVLAQHQYAVSVVWPDVSARAARAFVVLAGLFYVLHAHPSSPTLVPGLRPRFQHPVRQAVFALASLAAGCHLMYVTNEFAYYAVIKRAPPLGCLWVWTVLELDLCVAVASLAGAAVYMWYNGYGY